MINPSGPTYIVYNIRMQPIVHCAVSFTACTYGSCGADNDIIEYNQFLHVEPLIRICIILSSIGWDAPQGVFGGDGRELI